MNQSKAADAPRQDEASGPSHIDIAFACTLLRMVRGHRANLDAMNGLMSSVIWRRIAEAVAESQNKLVTLEVAAKAAKGQNGELIRSAIERAKPIVLATPDDPVGDSAPSKPVYATLEDAILAGGKMEYFWEGYIPKASLSLLAAPGGVGKTRLALAIARILWLGLPMPDGTPNPYPAGTTTIWYMSDRNFAETGEAATIMGFPTFAIHLNTLKETPFDLPDFDDPATINALRDQIRDSNAAIVFIDTITYATSKNQNKADEAKSAFDPIIKLAVETGVPVLALAHLNASGGVLGRRIEERARSVLSLTQPDPDGQPNRRRLEVSKSAMKKPKPIGITFNDLDLTFDDSPPCEPDVEQPKKRGPKTTKAHEHAKWLEQALRDGPKLWVALRDEGDEAGISESSLYNGKSAFPKAFPGRLIETYKATTPKTRDKELVHWHIITQPYVVAMDSELNEESST